MAADKKKIAASCWIKAGEAMHKANWDYAVDMFLQCVMLSPDSLAYRQHLRGAERKKYKDNKTGAKMAGMRLMKVKATIKKARLTKSWENIDRKAEEGLKVNPWDSYLNAALGEACLNLGYQEVAVFGYEKAVEAEPDNREYNQQLALLLEERGNYTEAISCWERIYKIDPLDSEARSKITQLQASSTLEHGGYVDAVSTQDVRTGYDYDRPVKSTIPDAVDGPGVSVEADLQRAIRKEPADVNNYLKLSDLYRREKKLPEASKTLQNALQASGGGDQNIREQLEDVELDQLRHNLAIARQAALDNPENATAKKNSAALARELLNREIEVFSSRVERYPKDSRLKYELACRFLRVKKWEQAIPILQGAGTDTRLVCEICVALGECFLNVNQIGMARTQFQRAVDQLNPYDKPNLFKKAHYALGRLCEQSDDRESSEKHYKEILAVDYEYRDARRRLERLQSEA